ncbi:MAG: helix-turn-helix transcriptional regulator [Acidobacteria bacterium]|nr:helix-turn-helix transcriptional regulator [Acidobacteriota bacterium]
MPAALAVIQSTASAETLLKPDRLRMLQLLAEPGSAAGLARKLQLPRQTVNYHLHELEREGFVEQVEQRRKGNCMERVLRATARSYVIAPQALGPLGLASGQVRDQFSSAYLVSAAARLVQDAATLRQRAHKAGKKLATLTLETQVRFANAGARKQFTEELLQAVATVAAKYHDPHAEGGRSFRFLVAGLPTITKTEVTDESPVHME